jgi:hypothetical protein
VGGGGRGLDIIILGCLGGEAVGFWRIDWALGDWIGSVRAEVKRGRLLLGKSWIHGLSAGCAPFAVCGLPFALCPSFRLPEQAFHDHTAWERQHAGHRGGAQEHRCEPLWAAMPAGGCKNGGRPRATVRCSGQQQATDAAAVAVIVAQ